jgi:pilus assembly protein CpaC
MHAAGSTYLGNARRAVRRPAHVVALVACVIVILAAAPQAQQAPGFAPAPSSISGSTAVRDAIDGSTIDLLVGRSTILNIGSPIARVSLTVPDVADALVTAPSQLLVHGKAPGTISLFVWDKFGAIKTFEVHVRRDLSSLSAQLKQLFPAETITVLGSGKDVVLSGTVSSQYVIEKAADVAAGYVDKKENVVNLLKQQEGVASNQVMLRVRFAEVSRSAVQELGASLFTGAGGFRDYVARTTTQQFAAPHFDEMVRSSIQGVDKWGGGRDTVDATGGQFSLSDFLNIFIFNNRYNVGTVIRALSEKGLFQSLAEPNLIATNGKEASFLAGGEFPYPVVQGGGANTAVTIQFKEFGVRLNFTPTVLGGDLINLKVRPEVSSLDFANGVTVEGFRVPALSTRRTETEVELRDGQTFAIAGLLNNTAVETMRKIPGIGDVPILGWLFKSRAMQKNQTELVVMITPQIIRKGQMGVSEGLPSLVEPYLDKPERTYPNPDAYIGSPRHPVTEQRQIGGDTPQPAPASAPVAAPAPAPASTPVSMPVPVQSQPSPVTQGSSAPTVPAPTPVPAAQAQAAPASAPAPASSAPVKAAAPSEEELRAQEKAAEELRKEEEKAEKAAAKAREAEEKRLAKERKEAEKRAEKERREAEKREKERAKQEAEAARKAAELERKRAKEEEERARAISEASARLKAAQEAYEAELAKANAKRPSGRN